MATEDCPGANKANNDVLAAGCWAEHADGSLMYVKGTENQQVVYELYDMAQDPPVYYQDAMRETAFKTQFSHPPTGTSKEKWTWHDKTPFPWSRVMRTFDKPRPVHADVHDTLSAAARVAESLRLRAQEIPPSHFEHAQQSAERVERKSGMAIRDRIQRAIGVLLGDD